MGDTTLPSRLDVLPAFPAGWYAVCLGADLERSQARGLTWCGREVVAWRTASGGAVLASAYCPHLGAHLGHGGVVLGEEIRCPMHHLRFGADGACRGAPGGRPPDAARLEVLPLKETGGVVFGWFEPDGGAPRFDLPDLDEEGFTPFRFHGWDRLATHPQETGENSVDLQHFAAVHGYRDVEVLAPMTVDGPRLTVRYGFTRPVDLGVARTSFRVEFTARLYGLGLSVVEASVIRFGLSIRQLVMATPTESGYLRLRVAASVRGGLVARLALPVLMRVFVADVAADHAIWEHKRYVRAPLLAGGDGPIGRYRAWAAQFYPGR